MDLKRKAGDFALVPAKKQKNEIVLRKGNLQQQLVASGPGRTSNLLAPIMLLSGHEGEIYTARFSPDGQILASAGFDRQIFLWNVYGECENFAVMKGHTGAILQLDFTSGSDQVVTCATDSLLMLWDVATGERVRKYRGHQTFVNSVDLARRGPQMMCSGSDDGTIKLWDSRRKIPVSSLQNTYQVTAVNFSDTAEQVISGGIDNDIKIWDLRKNEVLYRMRGHTDTVTGIELSPDGSYLLSTAMDNTVRIWDVRPYAPVERCVKIFQGNQHTFEKNLLHVAWSADGSKVSAGSGDRFVYIWDTTTRNIVYKLPGHAGSVNAVDFHPNEPIIVSGSSDKNIYLGEIEG